MECKDAENNQKFITVPSTINWTDLLQKLKHKYGRAVNFIYEADGHTYSVRDERDFKLCWDSVEEAYVKSNPINASALLQVFIIDMDPTKISSSTRQGPSRTGRMPHLAPKRVTIGGSSRTSGSELHGDGENSKRLARQQDYDKKHRGIDEMMRKTGFNTTEPSNMRKKWDKLMKECSLSDQRREKTIKVDDFKRALVRVDPNMTAEQVTAFVLFAVFVLSAPMGGCNGEITCVKQLILSIGKAGMRREV